MENVSLVIIGGGSAGLASAISAYDNGVKDILVIERSHELGGILNQCIHSGFGLSLLKEELTGPEYAHHFINELNKRNIKYLLDSLVLEINKNLEVVYSNSFGVNKIKAKAIICALGCNERTFSQIFIPGDRPKGVYTAGLAQKYLNIDGYLVGKNVYILGSGDIGLIMARRMTLEGANVIGVSETMPYSNGLNRNIVQCLDDFNIPLYLKTTVSKIVGNKVLEGIEISDVDEKQNIIPNTNRFIKCDTLLLSVGLYPFNTLLNKAGCKKNPLTNGALIDNNFETTIEGIFTTGNGLHVHDLVDFVSEESFIVGKKAAELILNLRNDVISELNVNNKDNVSYVLPNTIKLTNNNEEIYFYLRVRKKINKGKIKIMNDNKIIYSFIKMYLEPSEMIKFKIESNLLINLKEIDVEIEEIK